MASLLAGSTLDSCQLLKRCTGSPPKPVIDEKLYPVRWNSATIQLSANLTERQLIDSFIKAAPSLDTNDITIRRCACDPTLINVTLAGSYTISGVGDPATVQTGTTGTTGDLGLPAGSVVAVNYNLSPIIDIQQNQRPDVTGKTYPQLDTLLPPIAPAGATTVRIGVFDTGLLEGSYLPGTAWASAVQSCSAGVLNPSPTQPGYSFVSSTTATPEYLDDNGFRHGSQVARLIAHQFAGSRVGGVRVIPKIIPFKVLDQNNQGDMFSLLCALETARLNGVQVYNLSLGYYGEAQPLLLKYLQKILQNPNAYIVVAAGNRTDADMNGDRNVESMFPKFSPGSFALYADTATNFKRMLLVTTVQNLSTTIEGSRRQNYSPKFAWGVRSDLSDPATGDRFLMDVGSITITGSSFATPIVTGRLARLIGEGEANPVNKLFSQTQSGSAGSAGKQVRDNRYLPARPTPVP